MSSATHVYAIGGQTFDITATATANVTVSSSTYQNTYLARRNIDVNVVAPVVINFTSGSKTHLAGGDPDEYINYTQNGFTVTPDASGGQDTHFHLANGAMYTHIHDDELGGAGVVDVQQKNGGSFMLNSLVVPQLDNATGGCVTFTDSNGDSMTVTTAGTYTFDWSRSPRSPSRRTTCSIASINAATWIPSAWRRCRRWGRRRCVCRPGHRHEHGIAGDYHRGDDGHSRDHLHPAPVQRQRADHRLQSWTINWGDGTAADGDRQQNTLGHARLRHQRRVL